jgi:hypothetical protein
MRLLCPFCQKAISVPDSEAGKAVNCPECGQQFAAPQLFTPAPAAAPATGNGAKAAAAPPPPVPETYVHDRPADVTHLPQMERELSGYEHMVSAPLEPKVLRWIPPAALTLLFFLTFFSWDGMFPAGYPAYTQNAWQCLFGKVSADDVAEDEFKQKADFDDRVHSNWWLVFFFLFLFPALVLAWAGPVVEVAKINLPEGIRRAWHFRSALLGALVLASLLFLLAQWASGFGLQRAVYDKIESAYATQKAEANTPEKQQRYEMRVAMAKGGSLVKTTPWLRLAVLVHLLAAAAVVAEVGLMLRAAHKPPPRAAVMW